MNPANMIELDELEVNEVSGGIPLVVLVPAAIFVVGVIAGAYNAYREAAANKAK